MIKNTNVMQTKKKVKPVRKKVKPIRKKVKPIRNITSPKAKLQRRGFGNISPSTDNDFDDYTNEGGYETADEQALVMTKASIEYGELIFAKEPKSTQLGSMLYGLVNLENTTEYLSDKRVSEWGQVCNEASKFIRVVIYMSIELDLPKTMGLTQGAYFEKYFNLADYQVSKALRNVQTLVFLKHGVTSIYELEDRQCLSDIGDENDHVLNSYSTIRADHGDLHLLKVHEECNQIVADENSTKKVTGKLIQEVHKALLQNGALSQTIESGAIEEYERVEPALNLTEIEVVKRNTVHGVDLDADLEKFIDYCEKIQSISKCLVEHRPESVSEMKKQVSLLVETFGDLDT
ncbi:hypothetical protein [Shewanella sp. 6_MG-2023]|uniref:hypothetical protein n=1 Tax=Shewanella sp. 6_MG-2023 TaxID=3062660 RepID=UPI0026E28672|nr:hypothetical protein [Shewanella sp. 6_MG-2023]MDO6620231.1 hypothetical protein [Shewanella sp. 6_MG-2023]